MKTSEGGVRRPRLLDLFCGAGGAGMGYYRAGFEVVGVDIKPMPRYPFEFHQADALEYVVEHGHEFDAIHASPPCQVFCALKSMPNFRKEKHQNLIPQTRERLRSTGLPYVIENVPGAPLISPVKLCGTMFGLETSCGAQLRRHRLFETNWCLMCGLRCRHKSSGASISITGSTAQRNAIRNQIRETFPVSEARRAMGIDWMPMSGLRQAIPPAYTEYIGRQLLNFVELEATS